MTDNQVTAFILLVLTIVGTWIVMGINIIDLSNRVTNLEHACIPTDTGGGVTQCRQPNMRQTGSVAR